jgi:hypothetical protein
MAWHASCGRPRPISAERVAPLLPLDPPAERCQLVRVRSASAQRPSAGTWRGRARVPLLLGLRAGHLLAFREGSDMPSPRF